MAKTFLMALGLVAIFVGLSACVVEPGYVDVGRPHYRHY